MMERRDFITGMLAGAGFASGCRMVSPFVGGERARLKFGVVSDVHVKLAADGHLSTNYQQSSPYLHIFKNVKVD